MSAEPRPARQTGAAGVEGRAGRPPSPPVAVSTPGKLILMGEHAVVYGRPALVAAVDLRLFARFSPAAPGTPGEDLVVTLPWLGRLSRRQAVSWPELRDYSRSLRELWRRYRDDPRPETFRALRRDHREEPLHLIKAALGEAADWLGEEQAPPLALEIESQLPLGSGMGSSAAAAVALVAGYLLWRGAPAEPAVVAHLAHEVERRQHGSPSGVDAATVLHGGVLWVEPRAQEAGGLAIESLAAPGDLFCRFQVFDTGRPAEPTGEVVAAVRERRRRDPERIEAVLDGMAAATRGLRTALATTDPAAPVAPLRAFEAALEELGVVPAPIAAAVRRIEAAGGAAKISGAGSLAGPAAGALLVYHPDPQFVTDWMDWAPQAAFTPLLLHLGAAGLRVEPNL